MVRERVIDHPLGYEALDQLLKETEEPHRPWMYSGDYRGIGMGQLTIRAYLARAILTWIKQSFCCLCSKT